MSRRGGQALNPMAAWHLLAQILEMGQDYLSDGED